jgi:hypothetical protein
MNGGFPIGNYSFCRSASLCTGEFLGRNFLYPTAALKRGFALIVATTSEPHPTDARNAERLRPSHKYSTELPTGENIRLMNDARYNSNQMKRFRRWLFTGIAVLSLLLCVAMAAIWARSYCVSESFSNFRYLPPDMSVATKDFLPRANQQFTDIAVLRGELLVARTLRPVGYTGTSDGWKRLTQHTLPLLNQGTSFLNHCGFALGMDHPSDYPGASSFRLLFPLWGIVMLTAILPFWWLLRFRHTIERGRIEKGRCRKCGYDLRAAPDRCPECGTVSLKP